MSNFENADLATDPLADARLAAIVDSSFDAIISKDLNSVIQTWNPAAERLFGYSAAEAVGQSIRMLIPADLQDEEDRIIERIRRGERLESYETVRRRKDGALVHISITVSPVRNRNGDIVGASKVARDITATKENERRIRLLMREVNHRVKNQYAVIVSMIRETARSSPDPEAFLAQVQARIIALARSHDLLVDTEWSGARLSELIAQHLKPFGHEKRISISGPALTLQPNAVQHLGMAFHELGTNSAKYGALSEGEGSISVNWTVTAEAPGRAALALVWDETFAPRALEASRPPRRGFGSVVLERVTPLSLNGASTLERRPGGVRWTLQAPLEAVQSS